MSFSGDVAVDNSLNEILLNGVSVGTYAMGNSLYWLTYGSASEAYGLMNPISFSSSNVVAGGTNTLDFVAGNEAGTQTGIDISISGTYAVPEPASASLMFVAAVGMLSRRSRKLRI